MGRATVRALVAAGHDVRVFARDGERARATLAGLPVGIAVGDLATIGDVADALQGRDALIHAGATYRYDKAAETLSRANLGLAESALGAALQAGIRVVDVSSQVIFALGRDSVDPTTPLVKATDPAWRDPYLRSKVEAEDAARILDAEGLDRVTVHPSLVIGPDDPGPGTSGQLLVRVIAGGTLPDFRTALADVRDVAATIVAALGRSTRRALPRDRQRHHVSGPRRADRRADRSPGPPDVCAAAADARDCPPERLCRRAFARPRSGGLAGLRPG